MPYLLPLLWVAVAQAGPAPAAPPAKGAPAKVPAKAAKPSKKSAKAG